MSPSARREQVVASARAVIAERGLSRTSLRDIAARAGVSLGTVTYHFTGIDEILSAVVVRESERFYGGIVRAVDAEEDPRRALSLLIDPLFGDSTELEDHWRIWSDYWAAVARRPEIADAYADRIRHWEDCCARTIRRGIDAGAFRPVDPEEAALKLAAYADGLGAQRAQGVAGLTAADARSWLAELVDLLLTPPA
ncbi:TetR family transcriptional regulator [Microbacterium marinilacus]|nr:TetR family transcriptional regulator [Microbacterium marinilacus]